METDTIVIIESVDSINKDGLDTPICAIHYKMSKHSPKTNYKTACYIFAVLLQYAHAHVLCLYLLHCSLALDSILQLLLAAQDSDHAPLCSSSLPTQQIKSAINKYKKKFHDQVGIWKDQKTEIRMVGIIDKMHLPTRLFMETLLLENSVGMHLVYYPYHSCFCVFFNHTIPT